MSIKSLPNTSKKIHVDRTQFQKTNQGFSIANQKRIERAKQNLEYNQQLVIDLLPLLFHVNHPMLPGYISQETPCGLSNFKPSKSDLNSIKRVSKSFRYRSLDQRNSRIFSIFIMGSMGTLGQTRASDIDIWICYDPNLKDAEIHDLNEKCSLIAKWANENRLDLCFFPMNNELFLNGKSTPLSEESSGSTQHYLLLDEFYRSSLYLGGRQPLWWFVPSEYENNYQEYCRILLEKRFVRAEQVIDLGGLSDIPVNEFITAAIWQMYKAIQSPYKSILKLVLLEVYAHEFPEPNFLAHQFKRFIERSPEDIDASDPYLLLLSRLEEHLQAQGFTKRLETIRRSFYFKTGRSLSKKQSETSTSWQDDLLENQVNRWNWRQDKLENMDNRKRWPATNVINERQRLVTDLMNSYRMLSEFVRQHNSQCSPLHNEVTILGRKLYAAFERKSGKIEWINPDISPDISEKDLSFHPQPDKNFEHHWRLYTQRQPTPIDFQKPLKTSRSLVELAAWCYCNQIYSIGSHATLNPSLVDTTKANKIQNNNNAERHHSGESLDDFFSKLENWQPLPLSKPNQENYRKKPCLESLLLVVNLDPVSDSKSASIPTLNNDRKLELDPFNVGTPPMSLINSIELVVLNSWNELLVLTPPQPNHSSTALPHLLTEILSSINPDSDRSQQNISVYNRQTSRSQLLTQRIETLIEKMMICFHSSTAVKSTRFVLCYQGQFHLWQYNSGFQHQHFDDSIQLYQYLSEPQSQLSPLVFDSHTLQDTPLQAMTTLPASKAIQVGYRVLPQNNTLQPMAEIYCLDERGSVFIDQLPFRDEQSLLRPLHQFIRSAIQRLCLTEQTQEFFGVYPVEFYHLKRPTTANMQWSAQRIEITTELRNLNFFNIQAITTNDSGEEGDYSFYCDDQAFHSLDYGAKTYRRVASYILARRRQAERYPCYITDLDLSINHSGNQRAAEQLIDYLKVKSKLENALNQALQSI